jgi:hypothetical protein
MCCHEDDRHFTSLRQQVTVQVDAAHPWQAHVEYEAIRRAGLRRVQEFLRRG